jgi:hypothetical protein
VEIPPLNADFEKEGDSLMQKSDSPLSARRIKWPLPVALAVLAAGGVFIWQNRSEESNTELALRALHPNVSQEERYAVQRKMEIQKGQETLSSREISDSQSQAQFEQTADESSQLAESAPLLPANLAPVPDADLVRIIGSLLTDLNVTEMDAQALTQILSQQGIETRSQKAGNPKTGERLELIGEAPARGLGFVKAHFDVATDGKQHLGRLQFGVAPGEENYNLLMDSLQKRLPSNVTPQVVTESSGRWELTPEWLLWSKNFNKEEPHPVTQEKLVQVTLEFNIE